jgi:hypothetical protein
MLPRGSLSMSPLEAEAVGGGGARVNRSLIATDLMVAIRLGSVGRHGFMMGFETSRDRQMNGDAVCALRPDGGCIPQYPGFRALNVVVGHQWQALPALRVRVLGGPGYYTAYFDHNSTTTHGVGVGGRTDVAIPLFRPISATLAARGAWVPRLRGSSYVPGAVMIGVRLEMGR